jgi:hypothetical protein
VCRRGRAVALLDWEHVSPGRPIWDVASAMAMCVPFVSEERRHPAFRDVDVLARARLLADAYGLGDAEREALPAVLEQQRGVSEAFLRRRATERHPAYRLWWADPDGAEARHRAERAWLRAAAPELLAALRR